jgi:hypothetical protein
MWKVDPGGEFLFSDATNPDQALLFEKEPSLPALRALIVGRFAGTTVEVADIEDFVIDDTPCHKAHYKAVLREMEMGSPPALIPVVPGPTEGREPSPIRRFASDFLDCSAQVSAASHLVDVHRGDYAESLTRARNTVAVPSSV